MSFFRRMCVILVLVCGSAGLQYLFHLEKINYPPDPVLVLPASVWRIADMGLHSATASFVWLTAIQNFNPRLTAQFRNTADYIATVNELDPRFSYPYAFSVLALPIYHRFDEAMAIGERGLRDADPDYRIPYYMATAYHIYRDDRAAALRYFQIAALTPGAPQNVKAIAANYGSAKNHREQTREIWNTIYESSRDDIVRRQALAQLERLAIFDLLEAAAAKYKKQTGKYPVNIKELVSAGLLKEEPGDPLGLNYILDKAGRANVQ